MNGKNKQDVYWVVGPFIVFYGIALFAYYYTSKDPFLTSWTSLIAAIMLTVGGIIVIYIGDRSGRPSEITTG